MRSRESKVESQPPVGQVCEKAEGTAGSFSCVKSKDDEYGDEDEEGDGGSGCEEGGW